MPAQPSNEWSVQLVHADGSVNGQPFTLAELGIESADYDLNNLAADVFTLTVGGLALDAAVIWNYGQLVALLNPAGGRVFFGRVEPWTRDGKQAAQNHLGRLVNPWWYFEHKIYQQTYTISSYATIPGVTQGALPPVVYATYYTPRVVLNVLYNGNIGGPGFYACTTGQQIADAVNWAIQQGAPVKLGVIDPATTPFSRMEKGVTVAEVIKTMFRYEPDFVMDWDYSTLPFPTVHFRKVASLTPLNIDLTNAIIREQVSIKERPDWQRSYVVIYYDETNTNSAGTFLNIFSDIYPDPIPGDVESKFRGVDLFCDLSGSSSNTTTQSASFASQPFNITALATWQDWIPDLKPDATGQTGIVSTAVIETGSNPNYPAPTLVPIDELNPDGSAAALNLNCLYEIVDGEWADWITDTNKAPVAGQRVRAVCYVTTVDRSGKKETKPTHHDMTIVSLNTAGVSQAFTSTATTITAYAEQPPVGLAQSMFNSWKNLAIEGSFTNVEAVVGATAITRSNCLNFLTATPGVNGRPDWRNVNALVQRISGNIATGAGKVSFGAPLHLTGHELIDAVRATRYRTLTIDLGYLFGGALGGAGGSVKFGRKTHARHSAHGGAHKIIDVVSTSPQPVAGIDPVMSTDGTTASTRWTPPNYPVASLVPPLTAPVTLDPSKTKGSDGKWHTVQLQEEKVCVTNPDGSVSQRTRIFLCSETFQAPDDPA